MSVEQEIDPALLRRWARTLRGPVVLPGNLAYDDVRRVWNLAIDRHPSSIVRCADVDDVRRTIEFARTHDLPLAVRSGGHSQAGHGTCDGGIVLDLGALRAQEVDRDRQVVRAASGARVSDVQNATQAHGLLTPMGGCPEVGIGGLTLGGGENFLMARLGIVCDNVVRAEVVTADGEVVSASADEHADLFWAIRGGGGNFGVVVSLEYRLYPAIDVLFGQLFFTIDRTKDAMRRYLTLVADAPDELNTSCGLAAPADGPAFSVNFCFCGARSDGDRMLAAFRAALRADQDTVHWSPYGADLVVPAAPSVGTGFFIPRMRDEIVDAFADAVPQAPQGATAVFSHFHGAVTRVPVNAMAFPLRHPGFDLFITAPWHTPRGHEHATRWTAALAGALRPFARGVYVNNLNTDEAHRVRDAYGPNFDRLLAIKTTYDPANLFRVNHNVQPS